MTDLIHIHEDDWGMRSLHPIAAWAEVAADLGTSIEAGRRNQAPDGIGWTDVHLIKEPAVDFTAAGLSLSAAAERLSVVMPRVPRFIATATAGFYSATRDPYGSYEEDAWCFGFDATCYIKLEPEGDCVGRIWFEARTSDATRLAALRQAIVEIDAGAEAMLIDYWAHGAGRVRDAAFMERYFRWLRDESGVGS